MARMKRLVLYLASEVQQDLQASISVNEQLLKLTTFSITNVHLKKILLWSFVSYQPQIMCHAPDAVSSSCLKLCQSLEE